MSTATTVLAIVLAVTLPVVGEKSLTLKEPLSPVEAEGAKEILALDGGTLDAKAAVTKSEDGVDVALSVELPVFGLRTFTLDEKLTGLEDEAVDELLELDGGELDATATVTEQAA